MVTAELQTANVDYFSKKIPIIRVICVSGWLYVQINPDKWTSAVLTSAVKLFVSADNPVGHFFYIHGSVHRESNLITVQQKATYSVCYISVGSSTCFGC